MTTLFDVVYQTEQKLKTVASSQARLEARTLVCHLLKIDLAKLLTQGDAPFPEYLNGDLDGLIQRRLAFEPLSKIIGHREFYGLEFKVSHDVLDPRADTELIIDKALELLPDSLKPYQAMDCGTGSGCLPITFLKHRPQAQAVAVDISPQALAIAKENARTHGVENRLTFIHSSMLDGIGLSECLANKFDLVMSNPPYIPSKDIQALHRDVQNYDPHLALDGGMDGLDFYKALADLAPRVLKPEGVLIIEIGQEQESDVDQIFNEKLSQTLTWYPDLAGIIRCGIWKFTT